MTVHSDRPSPSWWSTITKSYARAPWLPQRRTRRATNLDRYQVCGKSSRQVQESSRPSVASEIQHLSHRDGMDL
jgi:hypothetical protein